MSGHLLTISIGPVQDFIASARRMGDLWVGSQILSDISRAVAQALAEKHCDLIFPAPEVLSKKNTSVANVILAEVPADADLPALAELAKKVANQAFRHKADAAFQALQASLRQPTWDNQVQDALEVFCAWAPLQGDYPAARKRVSELLAARKATREFSLAQGEWGVPKSSLDGQRETVLKDFSNDTRKPSPQLRLSGAEQLDCIGVVKRFCSQENRFASITTVAASPWLTRVKVFAPEKWAALADLHAQLLAHHVITLVPESLQPNLGCWEYEASPLYQSRHAQIIADAPEGKQENVKKICSDIADLVTALSKHKEIGKPDTYYAMILADGDRMGDALGNMKEAKQHREFSAKLETFASSVPALLGNHPGSVCIYAGGDDVLAFAPLDQAIPAAQALAKGFQDALMHVPGIDPGKVPTLSVGMVIVHIQEPLAIVRELAKKAEKLAKEGPEGTPQAEKRNALCVSLHTRGTDTAAVRGQWTQGFSERLEQWHQGFVTQSIPSNLPYATRRELEDLRGWENRDQLAAALPKRLLRVWKHKEIKLYALGHDVEKRLQGITTIAALNQLIAELRVGRFLAMGEER